MDRRFKDLAVPIPYPWKWIKDPNDPGQLVEGSGRVYNKGWIRNMETGQQYAFDTDCEDVLRRHKEALQREGEEGFVTWLTKRRYTRHCGPIPGSAASRPAAAAAASHGTLTEIWEHTHANFCGQINRTSPASDPPADGLQSLQNEREEGIPKKLWELAYTAFCGGSTPPPPPPTAS